MSIEESVHAYLKHKIFIQIAVYTSEGRIYRDQHAAALEKLWVESFKKLATDLDAGAGKINDDVEAEYALRKLEPPCELVEEFLDILTKKAKDSMDKASPQKILDIGESLLRDIEALEQESRDKQN